MNNNLSKAAQYYRLGPKFTDNVILEQAKSSDFIIHGNRAINAFLPDWLDKATEDWDIFSDNPVETARRLERVLDDVYGGDYFSVEPAQHPGTLRIRNKVTLRVVADVTLPKRTITYHTIDGVRYATLEYHVAQIKRTLADESSAFRHGRDRETLQRIAIHRRYPKRQSSLQKLVAPSVVRLFEPPWQISKE